MLRCWKSQGAPCPCLGNSYSEFSAQDKQRASFNSAQVNRREALFGIIGCDGCPEILQAGDCVYHYAVCNSGNFDLCPSCHVKQTHGCKHERFVSCIIHADRRWILPGTRLTCDLCERECEPRTQVHHCRICRNGNFDICVSCHDNHMPGRCLHKLHLLSIEFDDDKGLEKQANLGSLLDLKLPVQSPSSGSPTLSRASTIDPRLRGMIESTILDKKPDVRWGDIAGLDSAKDDLREAVILPVKHPELFSGRRKPKKAMLMYGPPGTGTSYLAKALCAEVDYPLFPLSSGDLMSKWHGESERYDALETSSLSP